MNWIDELSIERRTMFSNGLLVQTEDCKRIDQLINHMKETYPKGVLIKLKDKQRGGKQIPERFLILDGWEGLKEYEFTSESSWKIREIADSKKYGGDLRPLLPKVSEELEKPHTVVIIKNILKSDQPLNSALRSWCTSSKITLGFSSVILFAEDSSIFPEAVWSKMKIIDVPKSLPEERKQIIEETENDMAVTEKNQLDETKMNSAVRLLAGLDLDQVNAAVVESVIRDFSIKLDRLSSIKTNILSKDPALDVIQRPKFGFEAIGGYDALKTRLRDDIILPLKHPEYAAEFKMSPPRGVILFGPPGTGKTILSKAISKEVNMSILVMRPENLLSKFVGESEKAVKRVFRIADSMAPCILFMDELDRISKRAQTAGTDGGAQVHREIFSMFLEKLGDEEREWFFIGCTNMIESIDEAMRRTGRIDSIAPVPYPDEKAREEIFKIHSKVKRKLPLDNNVDFKELSKKDYTYMWSGSDIEQLVIRTAKYVMKESIKTQKSRKIKMEDFEEILKSFNVNTEDNERLQEAIKMQAGKLTNDIRLMDVFDEAQTVEDATKGEVARQMMDNEDNNKKEE